MTEWVPIVARIAVGVVLVFAGISKVRSRSWAVLALETGTPRSVVVTLPAVESLLGLALVLQLVVPVFSWIAVALFVAFTVVVVSRYVRGSDAPCNCFGDDGPVDRMTIVRNLALIALAFVGTF